MIPVDMKHKSSAENSPEFISRKELGISKLKDVNLNKKKSIQIYN
jgi:hypothetical protein